MSTENGGHDTPPHAVLPRETGEPIMEIEDIAHRNLPGRSLGTHSQLPPDGASTALGVCADHASVSPADPRALARNSRSPSKVTSSAYAVEPVPRPDPRTGRTLYALRAAHSLRASPEEACVLVDLDHCCGGHSGFPTRRRSPAGGSWSSMTSSPTVSPSARWPGAYARREPPRSPRWSWRDSHSVVERRCCQGPVPHRWVDIRSRFSPFAGLANGVRRASRHGGSRVPRVHRRQ